MLKIPSPDEEVPSLVARRPEDLVRDLTPVESTAGKVEKRRKHSHSKHHEEDEPSWEKAEVAPVRSRKTSRRTGVVFVAVGLFFVGTIGLVAFLMVDKDNKPLIVAPLPEKEAPAMVEDDSGEEPVELPEVMKKSEVEFLENARPIIKRFMEATSIEEMLPLVRNPEDVGPKMKRQYPDGKIDAPGLSAMTGREPVNYRGKFASLIVRTKDQEARQLAFTDTPDGLKIDWESYVGWSDMTWDEFLETKPIKPQIFRVLVKRTEYYNFNFESDTEWQSYRLISADGEHIVYGYLKQDSPVNLKVKPDDKKSEVAMLLSLKFRPGEESRNQVVIDRYITDGWVMGIDE